MEIDTQQKELEERFNALCERIASGEATQEEVHEAFNSFENDIEQFAVTVEEELMTRKKEKDE